MILEQQLPLPVKRQLHLEPENMERIIEQCEQHPPVILTMRHPMRIARGWLKRGQMLDDTFRVSLALLFETKERFSDSFWAPIDTPDRDDYLERIGERLDFDFETDWQPFGCAAHNHGRPRYKDQPGMSIDQCQQFVRTLPFDQFGYEL